jgi:hypothetical protein
MAYALTLCSLDLQGHDICYHDVATFTTCYHVDPHLISEGLMGEAVSARVMVTSTSKPS